MEIQDILNNDAILYKAQAALCTDRRLRSSDVAIVMLMVATCQERNKGNDVFTAAGIARDKGMSRTTVTSSFDRLEQYGYITSERDVVDGRSCRSKVLFSIEGSAASALKK